MGESIRIVLTVSGALVLAGCVAPRDFDTGLAIRSVDPRPDDVPTPKTVYFATTRCTDSPTATPGTPEELLGQRCWDAALKSEEVVRLGFGMTEGDRTTCGSATVAVPPKNAPKDAVATVDTPVSFDCTGDFAALRQAVLNTTCDCALIFVHGYNTTFAFGLKRTAQLALDLSYEGLPILFSFGAAGRLKDYVNDIEAEELAAAALRKLLVELSASPVDKTKTPDIDVITHSMGGRLALRAIVGDGLPSLRYVVLAAPDIDPAAFLRLAEKAVGHAHRLTVYTAKYDVAISASAGLHAGRSRVGEGLKAGVVQRLSGAEIVDATKRATDPYAHSYFAESKPVVDDIRAVLKDDDARARHKKTLICPDDGLAVPACEIPCPDGDSCSPTLFQRIVHWLFD